jgi:hypothetical protein
MRPAVHQPSASASTTMIASAIPDWTSSWCNTSRRCSASARRASSATSCASTSSWTDGPNGGSGTLGGWKNTSPGATALRTRT